ncbi:hypothetical protein C6P40_004181 [Pichia californica]|uniref:Uncharacterized protein n=1 Tax=Pichia californica TaxID=460514 RepID=A0A9P7BGE4_9ASCO|nr:hypothetical protein C6P42_004779 [[Candida] californica]KAG0689941.1 hypothetical protein C6P40_004181 [[Candida] californica]
MSDLKTISRSQLYESDHESNNDNDDLNIDQEYNLPPPGFDFEIVDIDDIEEKEDKEEKIEDEDEEAEEDEKVEFFPLFSTSNQSNDNNSINSNLVKVKMDIDSDNNEIDELITNIDKNKFTDEEWDRIVLKLNSNNRNINYYYKNTNNNSIEEINKFKSVAVDGNTILKWNEQFRIISDYKLINLNEFNKKIEDQIKISNKNLIKSKKRGGKKKRDAKIFKKERLKIWKLKLKEAKERSKQRIYKDHSNKPIKSTKTKFGDSFKKRNTISKNSLNNNNNNKPGKPIFRTE